MSIRSVKPSLHIGMSEAAIPTAAAERSGECKDSFALLSDVAAKTGAQRSAAGVSRFSYASKRFNALRIALIEAMLMLASNPTPKAMRPDFFLMLIYAAALESER